MGKRSGRAPANERGPRGKGRGLRRGPGGAEGLDARRAGGGGSRPAALGLYSWQGVCLFALLSPPAGSFVFCRPVQCFSPLGGSTAEGGKGVKAKRRVGCRGEQAGI